MRMLDPFWASGSFCQTFSDSPLETTASQKVLAFIF